MQDTSDKSLRIQDSKAEQQLARFMDEFFYSKLGIPFLRVKDKDMQLKGVDVILGQSEKKIDEKASLYYSNAMIPTFVFELEFIFNGKSHIGWYLNDELLTDYYMLIWPNIRDEYNPTLKKWVRREIRDISANDFTVIEAMLIDRRKVKNELEKRTLNTEHLSRYVELIRKGIDRKEYSIGKQIDDDVKIMISERLNEKPINLVINKRLLHGVADRVYLISKDGYANIKQ